LRRRALSKIADLAVMSAVIAGAIAAGRLLAWLPAAADKECYAALGAIESGRAGFPSE